VDIAKLIEAIGELKSAQSETYKAYKEMQNAETELKTQLLDELHRIGLKSAKGEKYSAAVSSKMDIAVTHEQSVIDWLNNTPNVESDAYIGLKLTNFKPLALKVLKETGEIIPGTITVSKESLSIRESK